MCIRQPLVQWVMVDQALQIYPIFFVQLTRGLLCHLHFD